MSRVALMLAVSDGEGDLAHHAVRRFVEAGWSDPPDVYVVDDASRRDVGRQVCASIQYTGCHVESVRLEHPLGFRGCVSRSVIGFHAIAASGRDYSYVVKIDPDTLITRSGLPEELDRRCVEGRGIWGMVRRMRVRDRVLFLMDLFPIGFRRRREGGQLIRHWELRRAGPVWWSGIGWAALRHGFRFRHPGGGFYVLGGKTFRKMAEREYFDRLDEDRFGFVSSEEDLVITLMVQSMGDPIYDLRDGDPSWGRLNISQGETFDQIMPERGYVVHPVKSVERQNAICKRVRAFENANHARPADC